MLRNKQFIFISLVFALMGSLASKAKGASTPQISSERSSIPALPQTHENLPESSNALFYDVNPEQIAAILSDYKGRVHPTFHIPERLKPLVGFWFQIYSKYSSHQIVVFDEHRPEIIYDVQDDRDLLAAGKNPVQIELNSQLRRKKKIAEYRAALETLRKNPRAKFKKGSAGERVLKLWGRKNSAHWALAAKNLRTQRGQRDFVMRGIRASEPFMPAMERIFSEYGLPTELTKIPLLESSFVIHAASKASAVGVWQFLENSGREYMTIDREKGIDERLSPIKSAVAAAKMFKRNMRLLDSYALAIIAYNHGPRNLVKLRRKYGTPNIVTLLDPNNKKSPLGFASRNYYAEFLAMLYAERYRSEIYSLPSRSFHYDAQIMKLDRSQSVFELAASQNADLTEIRRFNPDIFNLSKPLPKGTRVVIPRRIYRSYVQDSSGARKPSQIVE